MLYTFNLFAGSKEKKTSSLLKSSNNLVFVMKSAPKITSEARLSETRNLCFQEYLSTFILHSTEPRIFTGCAVALKHFIFESERGKFNFSKILVFII